ncbi:MAG TPA: hypothetical protein VGN72_06775 [Tepidisphaeraceae bacterium]|jgi:hypothetical protein|nr:hypothetical protein [Tepidisphaeraceae bacterium]
MSQVTQQTMKCAACGLKYPWSPQTAGRKIKCKCGTIFVAPTSLSAGPARTTTPKVSAAVARIAAARPAAPPAVGHADVSPISRRPATPTAPTAPIAPVEEPVIDLEDEDELPDAAGDLYDIADDLAAPPPLPNPAVPAAATTVAPARPAGKAPAGKGKAKGHVPAFPGYAPKKIDDSDEQKAQIKKLLIPLVGIALLVGVVFGARQLVGESQADYTTLPGDDGEFQRLADRDGAFEAREWLAANNARGVVGFFWTRNKTSMMLDRWYNDGAKKVLAFGTSPMTASMAIELPDDPTQRKTFIDYANQWRREKERGKPPVTDVGQKYVIIRFL